VTLARAARRWVRSGNGPDAQRYPQSEPLAAPLVRLEAAAAHDAVWDEPGCAVGDDEGEIVVHVAGNNGVSWSMLPMLELSGLERAVLDGAAGVFADGLVGVQPQMSLVPLHRGSRTWRETVHRPADRGDGLSSLVPGFPDPETVRPLHAYGIFVRPS
jgi:hypothetical protein